MLLDKGKIIKEKSKNDELCCKNKLQNCV